MDACPWTAWSGEMTFTRLSTVMNALLWVSREVGGDGGGWRVSERSARWEEQRFWWMLGAEGDIKLRVNHFCLANSNRMLCFYFNSIYSTINSPVLSSRLPAPLQPIILH